MEGTRRPLRSVVWLASTVAACALSFVAGRFSSSVRQEGGELLAVAGPGRPVVNNEESANYPGSAARVEVPALSPTTSSSKPEVGAIAETVRPPEPLGKLPTLEDCERSKDLNPTGAKLSPDTKQKVEAWLREHQRDFQTLVERVNETKNAAFEAKLARGDWTPLAMGEPAAAPKGSLSSLIRVDHEFGTRHVAIFAGDSADLDLALADQRWFLDQARLELVRLINPD